MKWTLLSMKGKPRRWLVCALAWLAVGGMFLALYRVAASTVMKEIRLNALGVAIAAAAGIDPADLRQIHGPADSNRPEFYRVQRFLDAVAQFNPGVRYVYTMRRAESAGGKPTRYEFIVDQQTRDDNQDGRIDRDELAEAPGTPYDATNVPELVNAWSHPSVDQEISPDPPYPDLMSGYAPIRDEQGRTMAIIGVDVTAATIGAKLLTLKLFMSGAGLLLVSLVTLMLLLYFHQRDLREERESLIAELRDALSKVKTLTGLLPICASCKKIRDDTGYWEQIEQYVSDHTEAAFTHSICPECVKKLYPEFPNRKVTQ